MFKKDKDHKKKKLLALGLLSAPFILKWKQIALVTSIVLILTVSVSSVYIHGDFWSLQGDTLVTNLKDGNVLIGDNTSLDKNTKLKVVGYSEFDGDVNNIGVSYFSWGSPTVPSIAFYENKSTGIYYSAPHGLHITCNGINSASFRPSMIELRNDVAILNGLQVNEDVLLGEGLQVVGDSDLLGKLEVEKEIRANNSILLHDTLLAFRSGLSQSPHVKYYDNELLTTLDGGKNFTVQGVNGNFIYETGYPFPTTKFIVDKDGNTNISGNLTTDDNITMIGNRTISATENITIGNAGDIILGDDVERDMYPYTTGKINLGTSTHKFNDGWFSGKLDVTGGVDPPYVLYNKESLFSILDRIDYEVPKDKDHKFDGLALWGDGINMFALNPKSGHQEQFVWKSDYDILEDRVDRLEMLIEELMK